MFYSTENITRRKIIGICFIISLVYTIVLYLFFTQSVKFFSTQFINIGKITKGSKVKIVNNSDFNASDITGYDGSKYINCSEYDLMGRVPLFPQTLINHYERREWLIQPNFSCIEKEIPFDVIAVILSNPLNHWRRQWV